MPRADDCDSHSPSSQSPVKRRIRAESGASAPNMSRRASSAGASAVCEDGDGGDADADDATFSGGTDFEVVDAASSSRAATEPYTKCFRLLAFFYRDAGRDAVKQTLPPPLDEYWALVVREGDVPSARDAVLHDVDSDGVCDECAERHEDGAECAAPFGAKARLLFSRDAEDGSRALVAWDYTAVATATASATGAQDVRQVTTTATAWNTFDWLRGRVTSTPPSSTSAVKRSAAALAPQVPADLPPTLAGVQVFGLYFAPFAWQRVGAGAGSSRHVV